MWAANNGGGVSRLIDEPDEAAQLQTNRKLITFYIADGGGLENMRNRAAKNDGECSVELSANGGTILKIRFPQ